MLLHREQRPLHFPSSVVMALNCSDFHSPTAHHWHQLIVGPYTLIYPYGR